MENTLSSLQQGTLIEDFRSFVQAGSFPCVGAKSALSRDRVEYQVCERLGSEASARTLQERLAQFSAEYPAPGVNPVSLVVIFRQQCASETEFHRLLWEQLQQVHDLDIARHHWAFGVSDDPTSTEFSFSVASRAFFVVGLHPRSSRLARRTPHPTLVFNFHEQFEALRTNGRYEKMQTAIRERDIALQGDINPVLAQFGEASEARQYSGHAGGECPFRARSRGARRMLTHHG